MPLITCFNHKFDFELFRVYRQILEVTNDFYWQEPYPFAPPSTYTAETDIETYWFAAAPDATVIEYEPTDGLLANFQTTGDLLAAGWVYEPPVPSQISEPLWGNWDVFNCRAAKMQELFPDMASDHEFADLPMRYCWDDRYWLEKIENKGTIIRFGTVWQILEGFWRKEEWLYVALIRPHTTHRSIIPAVTALTMFGLLGMGTAAAGRVKPI